MAASETTPATARPPVTMMLVDVANVVMRCALGGSVPPKTAGERAANMIERAAAQLGATHMVLVLDSMSPTWRKQLDADYKKDRTTDTMPFVAALFAEATARNWASTMVDGEEADDVIGSLAVRLRARARVLILTGDSDALALVDDPDPDGTPNGIFVVRPVPASKALVVLDAAAVRAEYDLEPRQLTDMKAIAGEPGDGITGIKGIGDGRASDLLRRYGTLEEVIEAGERGETKYATMVYEQRALVRHARRLVELRTNLPVPPIPPRVCAVDPELARRHAPGFRIERPRETTGAPVPGPAARRSSMRR